MNSPSSSPAPEWGNRRILSLVALGTLIVSVIWRLPDEAAFLGARLGEVFVALTLALAMCYVLRPIVRFLTRFCGGDTQRGRSVATLIAFVLMGIVLYIVFLVGFKPIQHDVRNFLPSNPAQRMVLMEKWRVALLQAATPYKSVLPTELFVDPEFLSKKLTGLAPGAWEWLKHQKAHLGFIVELLLVPVLAFYFLSDGPALRREARLLFPAAYRARLGRMGDHFDYVLDGYVRGQVWMCVIAWILVTLALWILGVPHAITLGLIAGLTRAIPVVGPLLGGVPLLLVCLFYTGSMETTGALLAGFTLMHFLESKVLLPKIVGHHVDLHPVSVILAILLGMEFFGALGVLLAVPIAAVIKIALSEFHAEREENARRVAEMETARCCDASETPGAHGGVNGAISQVRAGGSG